MPLTRSKLAVATIYESDEFGIPIGIAVPCMFNPYEYTISKANTYVESPANRKDVPRMAFQKAGAQTLKLALTFDAYLGTTDLTTTMKLLWKLMEANTRRAQDDKTKVVPPYVTFGWGVFKFVAVITSMTQTYTLFAQDGRPLRAKVNVDFEQFKDPHDFLDLMQNPTSGGGPAERMVRVQAGDRLDTLAARFYGDSSRWREIADRNAITNPLSLRSGQVLALPPE
jgi:hypothetical protein